jgi:alkylation response protein AidB-like acyl-CoA dehydrogenase
LTALVQVALAETVAEAEELEAMLREAGIEVELESAVEHHPREVDDTPVKVLVPERQLEAARDAIESLTEPDDPIAEA